MAVASLAALVASACSGDDATTETVTEGGSPTVLVTTGIWTDVVSKVACGGMADLSTIIPEGGDPHIFESSLQDRGRMESANLVVANGLGLEERLEKDFEAVEDSGTPVFKFAEVVESIPFSFESGGHDEGESDGHDEGESESDGHDESESESDGHDESESESDGHDEGESEGHDEGESDGHDEDEAEGHDEGESEGHDEDESEGHDEDESDGHDEDESDGHDEDESDGHDEGESDGHDEGESDGHDEGESDGHDEGSGGHEHEGGGDPHVWFDPVRVSGALPALADRLTAYLDLDAAAVDACVKDYQAELAELDDEIAAMVEQLPAGSRKLVTNHDALGYFADRYGFEVVGTVIPRAGAMAQTNAADLEELAETIEHEGVKAIFAESQHSTQDAEALAGRVGDVEVVTLYTGSLGPAGSGAEDYLGFMRTNTRLIVGALG